MVLNILLISSGMTTYTKVFQDTLEKDISIVINMYENYV